MEIRPATDKDLIAVRSILNREIAEGVAHFGLEPLSIEQIAAEFAAASGRHPWFVALDGEEVAGFCRASPWKSRGAYSQTAEVGVYVDPSFQGRGVGGDLFRAFMPACEQAGLHALLAGIRLPNDPCVRLHERFGFQHVGTLPQVGFKFGRWHDVGYWSKLFPASPTR